MFKITLFSRTEVSRDRLSNRMDSSWIRETHDNEKRERAELIFFFSLSFGIQNLRSKIIGRESLSIGVDLFAENWNYKCSMSRSIFSLWSVIIIYLSIN